GKARGHLYRVAWARAVSGIGARLEYRLTVLWEGAGYIGAFVCVAVGGRARGAWMGGGCAACAAQFVDCRASRVLRGCCVLAGDSTGSCVAWACAGFATAAGIHGPAGLG